MNSFDLYTRTSPVKLFLTVAIPGAISMLASSLWGIFDSIFVGSFLGETAFAAMNLALPFVLINNSLADMIGVGSAVPISIALGKEDRAAANNDFTCACITIVVLGAISGAVLFALAPLILSVMGAQGELARLGVAYLRTYACFSPFSTIVFAMDNYLRICGKIKSSMALNIIMSAVILIAQYFCICVWQLGIVGSPIAVAGGMVFCAFLALILFLRGKLTLRFCRPRFSLHIVCQFVSSGFPNFLNIMASRITSILMNVVLLKMGGTAAVTVYGILINIGDLVQQFLYGSCDSLQPAIGYNWGSRKWDRVKRIVLCTLVASAVISIGGMALMQMFPEALVSLFLEEGNRDLLPMAVDALRLYCLVNLLRWFPFAMQSFLIAIDKPAPASVLTAANSLVVPLALMVILYPIGLNGIWLNATVTSVIVSLLTIALFLRMKRRGEFAMK